jgi:hypothetical protein
MLSMLERATVSMLTVIQCAELSALPPLRLIFDLPP